MFNFKQSLTIIATGALLVGCSAGNKEAADTENKNQTIVAATQVDTQALQKIDQLFSLTPTQYEAQQKALTSCMASRGFTYTPSNRQNQRSLRSLISPSQLSLDQARSFGYQNQTSVLTEVSTGLDAPGAMEAFSGTSNSKIISVEGVPGGVKEDSCIASAYSELFGSTETGVFFEGGSLNLPLPYLNAAASDPRTQELNTQWSACMKNDYQLEYESPSIIAKYPDQQTINIATADAQCREKINYESQLLDIYNAYLTTFLNDNQNLIQQISDAKKLAETNAPKILSQ